MAIEIEWAGNAEFPAQSWRFGDDVPEIRVGREPQACQVAFNHQSRSFGREHCRLCRREGHYAIGCDSVHPVYWNDTLAENGDLIDSGGTLRLGENGPSLRVRIHSTSQLPATAPPAVPNSPGAVARRAEGVSRRARRLALLATIAVGLLGIVAWVRLSNVGRRQLTHEEAVEKAIDLAAKAAEKPTPPNWESVFRRVRPSIGLVTMRLAGGQERPMATAWCADEDRRLFATNAHVANLFLTLQPDEKILVRSPAPDAIEYEVVAVTVHPGYEAFNRLWDEYALARPSGTGFEFVRMPGPACDVALMTAAAGPKMPPALPLADDDALGSLSAGQPLGSVGYPMEGLALGGANPKVPSPMSHLAYVVAATDVFGRTGDAALAPQLVQHAIPATGGASGSPIVDERGNVVAIHNAGNVIGSIDGTRVESSAMIFFAQRADLVRELLTSQADDKQQRRLEEWTSAIAATFAPATRLALPGVIDDEKSMFTSAFESEELLSPQFTEPPVLESLPFDADQEPADLLGRWRISTGRTGRFLVIASTENSEGALSLDVTTSSGDSVYSGGLSDSAWFCTGTFGLVGASQATIEVRGSAGGRPVRIDGFALESGEFDVDELLKLRVARLCESEDLEPSEVVIDAACPMVAGSNSFREGKLNAMVSAPGTYIVVAVAEGIDLISLQATEASSPETRLLDTQRIGVSVGGRLEVSQAGNLEITVTSVDSPTCRVRVVRAEPLSNGATSQHERE
jgi:hypothetical protein